MIALFNMTPLRRGFFVGRTILTILTQPHSIWYKFDVIINKNLYQSGVYLCVSGKFVWTPPNYNYPSAYLIPSQVVIKQNIAVTKSYRLNNNESIS